MMIYIELEDPPRVLALAAFRKLGLGGLGFVGCLYLDTCLVEGVMGKWRKRFE